MQEWFLYSPAFGLNDATSFYVNTIASAGRLLGRELRHVTSVHLVPQEADVLVIDCKSAVRMRLSRPRARYWLWMQGIMPEEVRLHLRSRFREAYWTGLERLALPRARGVMVVSSAMQHYLVRKYRLDNLSWFRMPCVNTILDPTAFSVPGKYDAPSFVYAGKMQAWQCVDESLEVYRRVRAARPDATMAILTTDRAAANAAVAQARVAGVTVDYVPLERLQRALQRFKFGFALRRPHIVNAVSTPTKVSSYMASGVIPITTTAVHDFRSFLSELPIVMCDRLDPDAIASQILAAQDIPLHPEIVLERYRQIFQSHFDHSAYLPGLSQFLRKTGLSPTT